MRRLVLLCMAIAGVCALAACGGTGRRVWLSHPVTFSACADSPCGDYAVTLHWASVSGATDYPILVNGTQKADPSSSPYTLYGLACGTTYTLGVEAHDSAGNHGPLWTGSYTAPACGPQNTAAPVITGSPDISTFVAPQLVATTGSWTGTPTSYTYQWEDCNSSGATCQNGQGLAYGPGANGGSSCTNSSSLANYGCEYNLTSAEYNACPASGGSGACDVKLVVTASNTNGSTPVTVDAGTVTDTAAPSNPWPNYSNTGYQNAPANYNGYGNQSYAQATGGTQGVADQSLLSSAGSAGCPTTITSNTTVAFCVYSSQLRVGTQASPVSNVHFIGDVFETGPTPCCAQVNVGGTNYWTYDPTINQDAPLAVNCASNCTFDYDTIKPSALAVPDLAASSPGAVSTPGHGTTYSLAYADACDCGFESTSMQGATFDHADVWGGGGGFILDGNNTSSTSDVFQDNWIHDEGDCDADKIGVGTSTSGYCTQHQDEIGDVNTSSSTSYDTVNHNNMPFIETQNNSVAYQQGTYDHLTITNNVFSGSGWMTTVWDTSTNVTFTGNIWTNYAQSYYGPTYLSQTFWTGATNTWAHNKFEWDPTGATPFYQYGAGLGSYDQATSADAGMCWIPVTSDSQSNLSSTDYGGGTC